MVGMISKEDVEKVRERADLYEIVSQTVSLKPSGTGAFVGLCPFHDEKTPSFSVRPAMGLWHCFGCGKGGDVFKYVEETENLDFRDTVELLADKYHIELHFEQSSNAREHQGSKRARLIETNEEAQRFFTSQIMSEEALAARKMLGGRNFSQADCERFGCGYAPRGWDNLVRHLADKGFTQQEMVDAGLARRGQNGIYDYFRGRVTWPIRDSTGRTLGFGARKLYDDDQINAKYINTPDTQLYRKNQVLYGIDIAKAAIVKKRQVVIVEGYTDVMAMHLAGIDTAVATCGTAFGVEHAKIVRRLIKDDSLGAVQLVGPLHVDGEPLSSRIVFTFDGDAAGQKAALHAFELDATFQTQTFVAVADDNLDPCDLRIQQGDAAVRALIAQAKPLFDFVIDTAINRFDTTYTTGQLGALKAVAPLIAQIRDQSLWDMYARKVARRIGVDLDVIRREVIAERRKLHIRNEDAYAPRTRAVQHNSEQPADPSRQVSAMRDLARRDANNQTYWRIDDAVFMCEQQFMATLIQIPRAINDELFRALTIGCFITPVFKSLFQAITAAGGLPQADMAQGLWLHNLNKAAGPMLAPVISELAVMPLPLPPSEDDLRTGQEATVSAAASQLRPATPSEHQYAMQLIARLLDMGFMRRIGADKRRMERLADGPEKFALLDNITRLETERKNLQSEVFGNSVG